MSCQFLLHRDLYNPYFAKSSLPARPLKLRPCLAFARRLRLLWSNAYRPFPASPDPWDPLPVSGISRALTWTGYNPLDRGTDKKRLSFCSTLVSSGIAAKNVAAVEAPSCRQAIRDEREPADLRCFASTLIGLRAEAGWQHDILVLVRYSNIGALC